MADGRRRGYKGKQPGKVAPPLGPHRSFGLVKSGWFGPAFTRPRSVSALPPASGTATRDNQLPAATPCPGRQPRHLPAGRGGRRPRHGPEHPCRHSPRAGATVMRVTKFVTTSTRKRLDKVRRARGKAAWRAAMRCCCGPIYPRSVVPTKAGDRPRFTTLDLAAGSDHGYVDRHATRGMSVQRLPLAAWTRRNSRGSNLRKALFRRVDAS